ncbi:MAG: transporter substrate-binding domain-containing protein [Synergistaceae bacterium]|nr:transporter substrate-binding domain-containing protein [Synergistaceae bacterium]
MKNRKVFCALFVVLLIASSAFAALPSRRVQEVRGGILRFLGTSEEAFQKGLDEMSAMMSSSPLLQYAGTDPNIADAVEVIKSFNENRHVMTFFDSLTAMLMALDAGKLDEISLPVITARYIMTQDKSYRMLFTIKMPSSISFGFRKDSEALCNEFNGAIKAMKEDGTLDKLADKYIGNGFNFTSESVTFEKFDGADTIKVAVTGDLPPIDIIAADGTPTGYNTAVMAEIGKRLKKNIELLSIESGARSAALSSGRADVIFWYRSSEAIQFPEEAGLKDLQLNKVIVDSSEGVILSEPYYRWEAGSFLTK